jgi:hypothetical protein
MRDERFEVTVTFDERRGYVASAPELRLPVTALSLGGLRRRIEALTAARRSHHHVESGSRRSARARPPQQQAQLSRIAQLDQRTALLDQCLLSAEADVRPPRRKSGFDRCCRKRDFAGVSEQH